MTFFERLEQAASRNTSRLCVGLDPDPELMAGKEIGVFLREIIAATKDLVCCYKPNLAFFEALGPEGVELLRSTLEALRELAPDIPILADGKRGDIGSTAKAYARAVFDVWNFDAVTVNPYGGGDTVEPFLTYTDRGIFVWCRSSNPGATDFQDLEVLDSSGHRRRLYEVVATRAREWNAVYSNVGLCAGATYPHDICTLRQICPGIPFLIPGVGAQGGALADAVRAASCTPGQFIINASRSVLYASPHADFAEAARAEALRLRDAINDAQAPREVAAVT